MITKDLLSSVSSRADVLSRRYYFLEKEDLMQEGYMLLLDLEKKNLSNLQKHKAINNKFANLERDAIYRQRIEKNASSFEVEPDGPHNGESIDEVLEREEITHKLLEDLTSKETVIVEWLSQGVNIHQISETLGVSRDRVYKIVNEIIDKRRELERCDL
uniref:Putative DNA binding, helix-turn-helix domain containing protein n=1 Tax=viral metagenome TaxID=1070528 RepID=A0A6M3ITX1_9ZZZZ